nr:hypothetical protein [Tanacetum cinerariifolium]
KSEQNIDFHPIVDFIEASPLRYALTFKIRFPHPTVLVHWRNLKLQDDEGISFLPDTKLFENLTLMGYNISPNQKFTFQKDEPASPVRDVSEGEACPTDSGFIADQDRVTIAKSSTLPHDTAPRITSPAAVEGTQEVEINKLKARVKILEDNQGVIGTRSVDEAPIKGRRIDEEEGTTGRWFLPTAGPPAADIPTGSKVVPTASPVFAPATVVTPYSRRKGKEVMVESDTPKKQRLQEQIDA